MFRDETEAALERDLEALEASNLDKQSTIDQLKQQLEAQRVEIEHLRAATTLEHKRPGRRRRRKDSDPTIRRDRLESDAHQRRPRRDSSGQHTVVDPRRDPRNRRRIFVLLFAVGALVAVAAALALLTASC